MASSEFDGLLEKSALKEVLREIGFKELTPIQRESLPHLFAGRDLIGQSHTGSGKTVAFAVPLLERVKLQPRRLQALVLCPTRELCTQVAREIRRLGRRHAGLRVLVVCGGEPGRPQALALEQGVHVVVATPGRAVDHLERGRLDLSGIHYLVLDEADRMLDMGFEEQMRMLLDAIPAKRQTVFFSATFPARFRELSRAYQRDPVEVRIEATPATRAPIEASFYSVEDENKFAALRAVLEASKAASILVFGNLKRGVADLAEGLERHGVSATALHGDLEQFERERVLARFRNGSVRVLVATDVAARGLDVSGLDLVVNFDFPHQAEDYVHRIGRTGRAGQMGRAVSFVSSAERSRHRAVAEELGLPSALARFESASAVPRALVAEMVTISISGGRKDKLRAGDVLGALTGDAGGLDAKLIGKIEIHDRITYVAIAAEVADRAFASLRDGRIKGRRFNVERL